MLDREPCGIGVGIGLAGASGVTSGAGVALSSKEDKYENKYRKYNNKTYM